ncbi:MAG: hypothetical protein ACRCY7_04420 [Cetobacterium sp.]|uniref:hypothetical protein n=1 Tax=Cetobacterium sp. TaxID=2071632 RepID=UPI003F319D00
MSTKSKGEEFFLKLTQEERDTIIEIIRLEADPERLRKKNSEVTEREIKKIIEANAIEIDKD